MYAIIENGNKQYKVSEGETVRLEKLNAEVGAEVELNVLMVADENGVKLGGDVANAKVKATVVSSISLRRTSVKSKVTDSLSLRLRLKASPFNTPHPKK